MRTRTIASLLVVVLSSSGVNVRADGGTQLPYDPDVSITIGTGGFFGRSSHYRFLRIEPLFLKIGLRLYDRGLKCRWVCRWSVNAGINPENSWLGYRDEGRSTDTTDADGNDIVVRRSGVTDASLNSGMMWSGAGGFRLSLFDASGFHLDGYADYSASQREKVEVRNFDVHALLQRSTGSGMPIYGGELDFDATQLARTYGTVTFENRIADAGISAAFPFQPDWASAFDRVMPFVTFGYVWLDSRIGLAVDPVLLEQLAPFGVDAKDIPPGKSVKKGTVASTIGARFEIGRAHALEANGTFVYADGVIASMLKLSYSFRFDY